jgi:hypothetical protein
MSASQILLAGHGQGDQWLSDNPNRTYFEAKYQPKVNRSRETYEIPFDNQVTFDSTGRCTIPVKGDYMTRMTLRTVMPPIYPTVPGQYVFPTPSSEVGATVYVNKTLDLVVADGVTLTANTVGNHYFSIGAQVTLAGTAYVIFDLDGTYTITSIPTANSFTCSTVLAGISYNGIVSTPGIQCGDIISYFSTANSNLWVNNVTNKTWQITGATVVGNQVTFTTSTPSNFPVGSQVLLNLPSSGYLNETVTVTASTNTTFTTINGRFVAAGIYTQLYSSDNGNTWYRVADPLGGTNWTGVAYGNGVFVMVGIGSSNQAYSTDNGREWHGVNSPLAGGYYSIAYGNGVFVTTSNDSQAYSTDNGQSWNVVTSPISIPNDARYRNIAFGNNTFVAVSEYGQHAYSIDDGLSWTSSPSSSTGRCVAFGNGVFVMGGYYSQAYSINNGLTWTDVYSNTGYWYDISFGNNTFVLLSSISDNTSYSTDNGITWYASEQFPENGYWVSTAFGNGVFVITGFNSQAQPSFLYSYDGNIWFKAKSQVIAGGFTSIYGDFAYTNSPSDSVSLVTPPLQLTNRVFSSDVYPSISFANAADAAFWGFDSREGLTYSLTATPPWTLTQSGWISGFLPPSTSTYDDSVAHKLCKAVRLLVGKQTIKEYSGEYIELQNDLLVPYENKAILKLMNGTLDQTQATVAREYYVNLPLGTKEVPLCALTHQHMSVEIDFDSYLNVSQNLNQGTGDFLDAKSYTTYDASNGLLNGQPINVQTTFSYQQYIFIVTYGGQFIIFDTTKNVDDPASYIVLSAFSGSSLFNQFCVLSGNLYIGLTDGQLVRGLIDELIQGNISSLELNSYTPTVGSLTGTIVADFRYVYYTVSNAASSNVFLSRYDTTGVFTSPGSYTTFDFTQTFNSSITGVYQTLSTGTELVMLPQGTPGSLYTYQLNANVQSQWYLLDYSNYGYQITEGVLIGNTLYFICDNFNIIKYLESTFTVFSFLYPISTFIVVGSSFQAYSLDNGRTFNEVSAPLPGGWTNLAYGNGVVLMTDYYNVAYSNDNGISWNIVTPRPIGDWFSIAFGNGVFVMCGNNNQVYSTDNGLTWVFVDSPLAGAWGNLAFGNGVFVMSNGGSQAYSTDNGITWNYAVTSLPCGKITFGNGVFVGSTNNNQVYSTDNGITWNNASSPAPGSDWGIDIAYGNGVFIMTSSFNGQAFSNDNGLTWSYTPSTVLGFLNNITYENNIFYMINYTGQYYAYSFDNGNSWIEVYYDPPFSNFPYSLIALPPKIVVPGDGLRNLVAVGNYIYASTNNVAIQIDTSQDLSTAAAYKFPAPLPVNQYVLANGPRYVYMFAQGDNTATNIVEFDPYGPDTTFKASILVDYESLPEGVKKPDKALLGLIQTQKVTDMTQMNIKGPVKELWVTGASATTNVFQYSNLATLSTLELAGEQIVTDDDGTHTFLNVIEPFETHTSMPIRNVSVVSFEFDPESEIPNGTVNFSRIRDQIFDGDAETVWARTYNLFAIQGGIGNLMYN